MTDETENVVDDGGQSSSDTSGGSSQPDEVQSRAGSSPLTADRDHTVQVARGSIAEETSKDFGSPATIIYSSFVNQAERALEPDRSVSKMADQGAVWTVGAPGAEATYRLRLVAVRRSGRVHDLWVNRIDVATSTEQTVLHLRGTAAARFVRLMGNPALADLASAQLPAPNAPAGVVGTPELEAAYGRDPDLVRELIESDTNASDVIAYARRKQTLEDFRSLIDDPEMFTRRSGAEGGPERVWQKLFEANHWLLSGSLAGTLFTSWEPERLEQTAVGRSIASVGKRPDALLRSAGLIRSMVFVEIKHHQTPLVASSSYRSGTWPVSAELAGAVAQSQVTVQLVVEELRDRLQMTDADGVDIPGEFTYLFRPRSFVVAGSLAQLTGASGGHDQAKIRSFELYRRSLSGPEILTFDEVLARAELLVA